MSLFSKALVLITAAFVSLNFAAEPPNWDAPLIFDDFNDIYGDPINRTCLGAIKSYADNPGSFTKGKAGYWYAYSSGTDGSGDALVTNPGGEAITESNIATAFDETAQCLHVMFAIAANEEYCAIAANLLGEKVYADLSKMTSLSLKVKGTGYFRLYFETKYITDKKYDWGNIGSAPIKLTASWTTLDLTPAKLVPAQYSKAEKDSVKWADCKSGVTALAFEAGANEDGDKADAEIYVDSIVFKGMKYSDIVTPVSIRTFAHSANLSSGFSVAQNSINYTIAQPRNVAFSVFNLKGSVVRKIYGRNNAGSHTIMLPALTPGNYQVKWKVPTPRSG